MKSEPVLIDRIQVVDRLRSNLREETVTQIMESIPRVGGLLHPIAIRYVDGFAIDDDIIDGVPVLVAGRHRLEAMKRLGEQRIDCLIFETERQARRWEISENLHRNDLDRMQRAEHEAEWVKMEDEEGRSLQSGHGVRNESKRDDGRGHRPESGIAKAARELPIPGKTEEAKRKHLSRSVLIAEKTTPEAKQAIRMAGLADSTRALVEIARVPADQQLAKVAEIATAKAAPRPPRDTFTADRALEIIAGGIVEARTPSSLSSPVVGLAEAADADFVTSTRAALDEFLGRFAILDETQRRECLAGRDLSEVFDAYTNS